MKTSRLPIFIFIIISFYTPVGAQYMINLSLGSLQVHGDVNAKQHEINFLGVGFNNQISKWFAIEGAIGYGYAEGLNDQIFTIKSQGGGLVEDVYHENNVTRWVPSFSIKYGFVDFGINLKKYFWQDQFFIDFGVGLGLSGSSTSINLYNSKDENYVYEYVAQAFQQSLISLDYDNTYETQFGEGLFLNRQYYLKAGMHYSITKRGYFGLNARYQLVSTDYLDAIKYRTALDLTNNNDKIIMLTFSYTHLLGGSP